MSQTASPNATTGALRERVDRALDAFLWEQRALLADADAGSGALVDELRRVVMAGGKRLRPLFCYWGYRAAGLPDGAEIVTAAASLELLHTFALIHDDVMDRSSLRRGQPATHIAMASGDEHFGVSTAVLAGDLALALADEMLSSSGFQAHAMLAGFRWYSRMRVEVVAGQYLDLVAARGGAIDEATARRIAGMKSGGYTVEKPLLIGAALAGASPEIEATLAAYGRPLGEAFQLRDDLLGAFGEPAVTGKDAESDLREGKRTLLVARALESASPQDRAFIEAHLGDPALGAEDADRIRTIFGTSGALGSTKSLVEELHVTSLRALEGARIPAEALSALTELGDLAVARES